MNNNFKSDFSLFPIKRLDVPGWEYRIATWPSTIDKKVHKLFDGQNNDLIEYPRMKIRDGKIQNCKIVKEGDDIILEPGDGWNFLIKRDSYNNREPNDEIDDNDIPHDIKCLICFTNKRTHVIPSCFHVVSCVECAKILETMEKKECPICRTQYEGTLKRLFF